MSLYYRLLDFDPFMKCCTLSELQCSPVFLCSSLKCMHEKAGLWNISWEQGGKKRMILVRPFSPKSSRPPRHGKGKMPSLFKMGWSTGQNLDIFSKHHSAEEHQQREQSMSYPLTNPTGPITSWRLTKLGCDQCSGWHPAFWEKSICAEWGLLLPESSVGTVWALIRVEICFPHWKLYENLYFKDARLEGKAYFKIFLLK